MGNRIYHIAALSFLLFISCSKTKDGCTNKGELSELRREVGTFYQIRAEDRLDVELIYDPTRTGEVVLKGHLNLLDGVSLEVKDSCLILSDKNRCKWLRGLDNRVLCQVFVDSLSEIHSKDDAAFISPDTLLLTEMLFKHESTAGQNLILDIETLIIDHWEAGTLKLSGKCGMLVANMYETGKLEAREMPGDLVYIFHYGLNDVSVSPKLELGCLIENSGNVYYHQDPLNKLDVSGRGSGRVVRVF